MAEAILCGTLILTVAKTFLVVDEVFLPGEGSGVIARAATSIHQATSARSPVASPVASPRQRPRGPAVAGASKVRGLHRRLLCMHVTAALVQGAGAAKYSLPVSDTSCLVTHRIMVMQLLLNDASLVLFLLAKVHVTNGARPLACWEKGTIWWSRFYAWIYLPYAAILLGTGVPGRASSEGTFCYNGRAEVGSSGLSTAGNAMSFGLNNALLIMQFILLLGLFVRPMLVRVEGTQSGGAVYRRVVLRNTVCTIAIVASYTVTTVVVVLALLRESPTSNTSAQIRDGMFGINSLSTLCLTEIALPLGFASCFKTCRKAITGGNTDNNQSGNHNAGPGACTNTATAATTTKVVPVQNLPPQTP